MNAFSRCQGRKSTCTFLDLLHMMCPIGYELALITSQGLWALVASRLRVSRHSYNEVHCPWMYFPAYSIIVHETRHKSTL